MIGLKDSRHFFIQPEVKPKLIVSRLHAFSRAMRPLHVITSSFDWFTVLSASFVIGLLWFWFYDTEMKTPVCSELKLHLMTDTPEIVNTGN